MNRYRSPGRGRRFRVLLILTLPWRGRQCRGWAVEFLRNLFHALGSFAYVSRYWYVKRLDLGMNVLAIGRKLIGDVNHLCRDDPANPGSHGNRNHDGGENGNDAAGVQFLETGHHRGQQECQRESECEGDQNLARKVQRDDGPKEDYGPSITPQLRLCREPGWRQVMS